MYAEQQEQQPVSDNTTNEQSTLPHGAPHQLSHDSPVGSALRYWGPYVLTAIVVPGGIVVALVMLARRWYRHRQTNAIASTRVASA